jgi:ubiquinone/menaquinone biosynthesis C-methylase UbiE
MVKQVEVLGWLSVRAMRILYWRLSSWVQRMPYVPALNYGYKEVAGESSFSPPTVENRVQLRLYHRVVGSYCLDQEQDHPLEIAEVGCGLGVGADWLSSFLDKKLSVLYGIDQSKASTSFCRKRYAHNSRLSFRHGDATRLPLADQSMDIVFSIESSHMWPDMGAALTEISRVLRPDGSFFWADFREAPAKHKALEAIEEEFDILDEEDMTEGVARALTSREEQDRKEKLLSDLMRSVSFTERLLMKKLLKYLRIFMGMEASDTVRQFQAKTLVYTRVVARKKSASS